MIYVEFNIIVILWYFSALWRSWGRVYGNHIADGKPCLCGADAPGVWSSRGKTNSPRFYYFWEQSSSCIYLFYGPNPAPLLSLSIYWHHQSRMEGQERDNETKMERIVPKIRELHELPTHRHYRIRKYETPLSCALLVRLKRVGLIVEFHLLRISFNLTGSEEIDWQSHVVYRAEQLEDEINDKLGRALATSISGGLQRLIKWLVVATWLFRDLAMSFTVKIPMYCICALCRLELVTRRDLQWSWQFYVQVQEEGSYCLWDWLIHLHEKDYYLL